MDTTMLLVIGTGLTAITSWIGLFAAVWRVMGGRFTALERQIDKQFAAVDKQFAAVDKQFAAADQRWNDRFEMAENASRERSAAIDKRWNDLFAAMDQRWNGLFAAMDQRWNERFESYEKQNEAAHAAICASVARLEVRLERLDERTRADAAALREHFDKRFDAVNGRFDRMNGRFDRMNGRFDDLNGRFDDLCRHLLGAPPPPEQPGPGTDAG